MKETRKCTQCTQTFRCSTTARKLTCSARCSIIHHDNRVNSDSHRKERRDVYARKKASANTKYVELGCVKP